VDTIGRAVMTEMSRLLGQAVVLDNRAGAAGAIGVEAARQAQALPHKAPQQLIKASLKCKRFV
jgi:tripartite-type tricarboxylate transporter receptor subunit TctC